MREFEKGVKQREGRDEVVGYPSNMYIVYYHRHPETREIVYVGEGTIDRAYDIRRTVKHHNWLVTQLKKFPIHEIVEIIGGNYTKEEARAIEKHEIKHIIRNDPGHSLFNKEYVLPHNFSREKRISPQRLFTEEMINIGLEMRANNKSFKEIGERFGVSRSTVQNHLREAENKRGLIASTVIRNKAYERNRTISKQYADNCESESSKINQSV